VLVVPRAGIRKTITTTPRGERTVVMMPGARAAWFARSEAGRAQLGHEMLTREFEGDAACLTSAHDSSTEKRLASATHRHRGRGACYLITWYLRHSQFA
jgi:hypothetical protein